MEVSNFCCKAATFDFLFAAAFKTCFVVVELLGNVYEFLTLPLVKLEGAFAAGVVVVFSTVGF